MAQPTSASRGEGGATRARPDAGTTAEPHAEYSHQVPGRDQRVSRSAVRVLEPAMTHLLLTEGRDHETVT